MNNAAAQEITPLSGPRIEPCDRLRSRPHPEDNTDSPTATDPAHPEWFSKLIRCKFAYSNG